MDEKTALRSEMRAARRAFVADLPQATRALILRRPPAPLLELVPEGCTVGLYCAGPDEAPATGYARWFVENGRQIAAPFFPARDAAMEFRGWSDPFGEADLADGPFCRQPSAEAATVVPEVVFVPLLAFTTDGARLGQGGGHYDRWLANHPHVTAIGLAWDMQLRDSLPIEPHDMRLTAVVTPTRLFRSQS